MNDNLKNRIDGCKLRFVLSAGRVGTTSLREYLKHNVAKVDVAFEPDSSRPCFILWNIEQFFNISNDLSEKYVIKQRIKDYKNIQSDFVRIEINTFLSPFCNVLTQHVENMHVVHIVRHPYTWISSIMNFRALGWHRHFIDLIPFTRVIHPLAKSEWRNLSEAEKFAWRWRLHNEQILDSKQNYEKYIFSKYEDLSLGNDEIRQKKLADILAVLLPDYNNSNLDISKLGKFNVSKVKQSNALKNFPVTIQGKIHEICASLMEKFDYKNEF